MDRTLRRRLLVISAVALFAEREGNVGERRREQKVAVRHLQQTRRRTVSAVQRDLPDFDTTGLNDTEVPEDAIAQARETVKRIEARAAALPYAEQLLAPLATAIELADNTMSAFYEADTLAQQAHNEQYEAAAMLDGKLIAFRAILRSVIGSKHRDYRKLRVRRGRGLDEDLDLDDTDPPQPQPVEDAVPARVSVTNGSS